MWQLPWGFRESIATAVGVIIIGVSLQLAVGSFNFYLLSQPVNLVVAIVIIILSTVCGLASRKSQLAKWIAGVPLSTSLICALLGLSAIMGLVLQQSESTTTIGLDSMTSNWAFVLIYTMVLIALGSVIVRRATHFKIKDYAFYLNHLGLWILLASSGLGYSDMERYIMHIQEGETEWRVYDANNTIKELPIAIKLLDFDMEVYPPKLAIIDRATGAVQPEESPQFLQLDNEVISEVINGWHIEVKEYIHNAVRNSDSTYRAMPMAGATPAANITVSKNGLIHSGWVCGGNSAQLYMTIALDQEFRVVMTTPEPRTFSSEVEVFAQDGSKKSGKIEVNHPLTIGHWMIYQYGYDNEAGKLSSYSSFELVFDPYIKIVYLGIIMLMAGSACMIWSKKGRV